MRLGANASHAERDTQRTEDSMEIAELGGLLGGLGTLLLGIAAVWWVSLKSN